MAVAQCDALYGATNRAAHPAIEQANKNLLQAEKLAAVGQLAAGIAHEINTPAQYVGDNLQAIGDFFASVTHLLEQYRKLLAAQGEHRQLIDQLEQQADLAFILEDAPLAIAQSLEGISQIVRIVQAMKGSRIADKATPAGST